jgi:hypothetical protein
MPGAQVSAQITFDGGSLNFRDEFSQPIVTVEFGKLSKTHETIGKDKITQIFGEKADRIRVEGVITQNQIEDVYDLTEVADSAKSATLLLEEWSGEAVLGDSASIKPRQEVHTDDGDQYWLYDVTLPFIEVERATSAQEAVPEGRDIKPKQGNPDFTAQKTGSSGNDNSDDGGDSSSEETGPDEPPDLGGSISVEKDESKVTGILTTSTAERLAEDRLQERLENEDAYGNVTQVTTSNVSGSQGGDKSEFTGEISYYYSKNGETVTLDFKIVITDEGII